MKNKFILLIILALLSGGNLRSGDNPPDDCFFNKNERAYVHLQKQEFFTGESLNYQAYVANLSTLKPGVQSKVLYFALKNAEDQLAMTWRDNLDRGVCFGSVSLPDTLSSGVYTLYAFTNRMRNISSAYYHRARILITKVSDRLPEKLTLPAPQSNTESLISFFPEGGALVSGIANHIGFRINRPDLLPKILSATVKDGDGNVVDTLLLSEFGIGKFELAPENGMTYTAEIVIPDEGIINIPLPDTQSQGYAIKVEEASSFFRVGINSNFDAGADQKQMNVIAHSKGKTIFTNPVLLRNGSGHLKIDKSLLPEGVILLSVVDPTKNAVAERLVFCKKENKPRLRVAKVKSEYDKGENIKIEIEAGDFAPDDAVSFSVSVTAVSPLRPRLNNYDIDAYFNLYSEIQNLPFAGAIDELPANDLGLVTETSHYARHPDLPDSETDCRYITEDKGYVLSGRITSPDSVTPIHNAAVLLSYVDSLSWLDYSYVDPSGHFQFLLNRKYDNKELILQLMPSGTGYQNAVWHMDDKYRDIGPATAITSSLDAKEKQYLDLHRKVFLIENIYNPGEKSGSSVAGVRRFNFYGEPDYTIYPDEYTPLNDFTDISANILNGVRFRTRKDTAYVNILDFEKKEFFTNNALVLLNGIPFYDLSYLRPLRSDDIKRLDVVGSRVIYGELTFYGALSIQTTDGLIPPSYFETRAHLFENSIYAEEGRKNFIAHARPNSADLPDLKQTLYWRPDITINGGDKIILEFSASNLCSDYEINIQGIAGNGAPVSNSSYFKVK